MAIVVDLCDWFYQLELGVIPGGNPSGSFIASQIDQF